MLKGIFFLMLLVNNGFVSAESSVRARDWSAKRNGNVALTFYITAKTGKIKTLSYQDKRDGISGVLWDYSKIELGSYKNPVMVAIFGHGAKSYSLKIIDPLLPEKEMVLFQQSSTSDLPSYEVIGKDKDQVLRITAFKQVASEPNDLYANVSNLEAVGVDWPIPSREVQSQKANETKPPVKTQKK